MRPGCSPAPPRLQAYVPQASVRTRHRRTCASPPAAPRSPPPPPPRRPSRPRRRWPPSGVCHRGLEPRTSRSHTTGTQQVQAQAQAPAQAQVQVQVQVRYSHVRASRRIGGGCSAPCPLPPPPTRPGPAADTSTQLRKVNSPLLDSVDAGPASKLEPKRRPGGATACPFFPAGQSEALGIASAVGRGGAAACYPCRL